MDIYLKYKGGLSASGVLDAYDAAQAIDGFQRSLALTTHLVVNGEIITQAPSLRNAEIFIRPPQRGSWEIAASLALGAGALAYKYGTAPTDTPLGHIVSSVYDFAVRRTLGLKVDYNETLSETLERASKEKEISASKIDALSEKIEVPLKRMHRPMVASGSASEADIGVVDGDNPFTTLDSNTYEMLNFEDKSDLPVKENGKVSSFNINTMKGRIYLESENRPIPFELVGDARTLSERIKITQSLTFNSANQGTNAIVEITAFRNTRRNGTLKSLDVIAVEFPD